MANYTKKIVKGSIIVLALSILASVAAYFVRILFARNLTTEQYGLFYSIFAFLTIAGIFADLGLTPALANFISRFKSKNKLELVKSSIVTVALIQLISYAAVGAVVFLMSNFLSIHYFKSLGASLVLRLIMVHFFFNGFVYVLWRTFQGFQKMGYYASVDLLRMIFVLLISFFLFKRGFGILGAAIAYIITTIILILVYYRILTKKVFPSFTKIKAALDKGLTKELFKFGIPVTFGAAAIIILSLTDTVMLTYLSDLKMVGLYNVAMPTAKLLLYFGIAIGGTLFPLITEMWSENRKELIRFYMGILYKYSFMIILPFSLMIFSFPGIIIRLMFGEPYLGASTALRILSLSALVMALTQINFNVIAGIGKPIVNSKITYVGAALNVILNSILIPIYGIAGAAFATLISFLVILILNLRYLQKKIGIKIPLKTWSVNLLIGAIFLLIIMAVKGVIAFNPWLELSVVAIISLPAYLVLLYAFRLINIKELKNILR